MYTGPGQSAFNQTISSSTFNVPFSKDANGGDAAAVAFTLSVRRYSFFTLQSRFLTDFVPSRLPAPISDAEPVLKLRQVRSLSSLLPSSLRR